MEKTFGEILERVRSKRLLVHHITNIVVANDNANCMLAVGALPVMAYAREEVEEMVAQAQALVINLGTLTGEVVESAILAARKANEVGIPVILDPVGAGATSFRTQSALQVLETAKVSVLRGNRAEIASLLGMRALVRGVESGEVEESPCAIVEKASLRFGTVVAITGEVDWVSDGKRVIRVFNGHPLLTKVTGTGCMATSLCGAFCGVEKDFLMATAAALSFLGVCAEKAAPFSLGPASFRNHLFDMMYKVDGDTFARMARFEVESL